MSDPMSDPKPKRSHHSQRERNRPPAEHPSADSHSPVHVNPGQQPPRDGEECASLTYDARLRMWVYVASYDDRTVCWVNRAAPLRETFGVPFICVFIGDATPRDDHRARQRAATQRYISGWYAATYADPRPSVAKRVAKPQASDTREDEWS